MSRCFPFPPPGYEKKGRIEDTDLLTKEKHKEKKHKKDKKDKEKREGSKEKKNKDKERGKEKLSDKKDRKANHKDKKDKDKDKDKDKSRTSNAKRIEGQPECNDGDKLGPNSVQNNEVSDSKYVQDLARRIKDDNRATKSQIGPKSTVTDPRRCELRGRMVERSIENLLGKKEKANHGKEDDKKVNGQRNHVKVRSFGNAIVPGFPSVDQQRFQGIAKPLEKNDIGKKVEEKEKNNPKERYNKDSKLKDRDREKKKKSNDEKRDKKKKKEEKVKEVSETCKDQIKLKYSSPKLKDSSKDILNSCNTKTLDVLKTSTKNPAFEGNLGKRKELEINGISHDSGIRPNKFQRPVSFSHQVMENGRKLEPCHSIVPFESELQGEVHNHIVDTKEQKINGLMEVSKPILHSSGPLSSKARISENGEAPVKPPHPDSKYLNQIFSVPKLEDCSDDLDEQEWLFSSDCRQSKKPKLGSSEVDGTQVWSEALWIGYADLTALPYVIPF